MIIAIADVLVAVLAIVVILLIKKNNKKTPKIKIDDKFILDIDATKIINEKINNMIKEKIEEQNNYLYSKRVDGHVYEVGEKYSDTILLYDLNSSINGEIESFEEIEFSKELFDFVAEGDKGVYKNGEYNVYS